jgi:hypothetical protein
MIFYFIIFIIIQSEIIWIQKCKYTLRNTIPKFLTKKQILFPCESNRIKSLLLR